MNIKKYALLGFLILSLQNIQAQYSNIDNYFREQRHIIDSLTSRRLMNKVEPKIAKQNVTKAVNTYLILYQKYRVDIISFFYYSIFAESPEGFYQSCKQLIYESGDSVSGIIEKYGNIYGQNDLAVLYKQPLANAIKRIKKEESNCIQYARSHLDWNWCAELNALFKANIDFRYIPTEYYRNDDDARSAIVFIDSIHFFEFCELVEKLGFPFESRVGVKASLIMAPLKHFTALVYFEGDLKRSDLYIEKWKGLMPSLYYATKTGQLDESFYKHLQEWLFDFLKKDNKKEAIDFFKTFTIE